MQKQDIKGPAASGEHNVLAANEEGVIFVVVAILSGLLVLLAFGWAIDLPTTQSSLVRAQQAIDQGAISGVNNYLSHAAAAQMAYTHTNNWLQNQYSPSLEGYLFGLDRPTSQLRILTPRPGGSGDRLTHFANTSCNIGTACTPFSGPDPMSARYLPALNQTFDVNGVDDYKNGIAVFGRFSPFSYFPGLSAQSIEVAATAQLKTSFSYILIDPAFTIEDNFESIFGLTPCSTDNRMWPPASPRSPNLPTYGSWTWPPVSGLFGRRPTGTNRGNGVSDNCIYRFYASMCDSQAFYAYKQAAVTLIDRLAHTSAFDSTTLVGLTGYREEDFGRTVEQPIVPVHPKFAVPVSGSTCPDRIASHFPESGIAFPLQSALGAEADDNRGLHSPKRTAFEGFVDSTDVDPSSNRNRDCGSPGQIAGSGLNRWELCLCRGLFLDDRTDNYLLVDDSIPPDEPDFTHAPPGNRKRSNLAINWCDDLPAGGADTVVQLEEAQGGSRGGETTRNLIANLAIRTEDPRLGRIDRDFPGSATWIRPLPENRTIRTGWRDVATSLAAARTALRSAVNQYAADGTYGALRPSSGATVTLFAFGFWSSTVEETEMEKLLTDRATVQANRRTALRDELIRLVCEEQIGLISALLPMNYHDKITVSHGASLIAQLEAIRSSQLTNTPLATGAAPDFAGTLCERNTLPMIATFIYDFDAARFLNPSAPHLGKLSAALAFGREIPDHIMKLLVRYEVRI